VRCGVSEHDRHQRVHEAPRELERPMAAVDARGARDTARWRSSQWTPCAATARSALRAIPSSTSPTPSSARMLMGGPGPDGSDPGFMTQGAIFYEVRSVGQKSNGMLEQLFVRPSMAQPPTAASTATQEPGGRLSRSARAWPAAAAPTSRRADFPRGADQRRPGAVRFGARLSGADTAARRWRTSTSSGVVRLRASSRRIDAAWPDAASHASPAIERAPRRAHHDRSPGARFKAITCAALAQKRAV
jgi:hypothetical protein